MTAIDIDDDCRCPHCGEYVAEVEHLQDALAAAQAEAARMRTEEGLPPDLLRVLRDPSIIISRDSVVFELIARWNAAPCPTASALNLDGDDGPTQGFTP